MRGASVEHSVSECGVRVWCAQIFDRTQGVSECHEHGSSVSIRPIQDESEGCVCDFFSVAWSVYFFYPRIFKSEVGILTVCVVFNKWNLNCELQN